MVLQRTVLYIFHFYKLKVTFNDSIYAIKRNLVIIFHVIVLIIFFGYFGMVYIVTYDDNELCRNIEYVKIVVISCIVLDILLSIALTRMFTKRLSNVLSMHMSASMYNVLKKVGILCLVSIISSIIFILIPSIFGAYISPYKIFGFDLVFSNLCLLLQFGKTNKLYEYICCVNCIKCIRITNANPDFMLNTISNSRSLRTSTIQSTAQTPVPQSTRKGINNDEQKHTNTADDNTTCKDEGINIEYNNDSIDDIITSIANYKKATDMDDISKFVVGLTQKTTTIIVIKPDIKPSKPKSPSIINTKESLSISINIENETNKDDTDNLERKKKLTPKLCKSALMDLGYIVM